jgi:hypothetical protein
MVQIGELMTKSPFNSQSIKSFKGWAAYNETRVDDLEMIGDPDVN